MVPQLTRGQWGVFAFSVVYVLGFTAYYVSIENYEFLWYVAVLVFFLGFILATIQKSCFPLSILWGLAVWGLLHMAGGGLVVNGEVLYALHLFDVVGSGDAYILKYDQFVHAFGFGVAALVAMHLLRPHWVGSTFWLSVMSVLIAMGLGAVNEIVEFIAVVLVPDTGVGGYYNTAIDLVFNTIGATVAVVAAHLVGKK